MNPQSILCLIYNGNGVSKLSALAVAGVLDSYVKTNLVTSFSDHILKLDHDIGGVRVVVVIPGGDERQIMISLGSSGKRSLRRFVLKHKGTFVGICAGATIATTRKRNSLSLLRLRCMDDNRDRECKMVVLHSDKDSKFSGPEWSYSNGPWMAKMKRNPPSLTHVWYFDTYPSCYCCVLVW